MQLQLETDELDLVANVLLEREAAQAGADFEMCEELLDRVVARDMKFDSDQLQQLADILGEYQHGLQDAVARETKPGVKAKLQTKLGKLAHVVERVEEACVMF
jgi:uncharacterized coiled-coil protein SlyX